MTNVRMKEKLVKLHILVSLAKSQRALSRIITNIADVSDVSKHTPERLLRHVEEISRYQKVLAAKISGIRIGVVRKGIPKQPWLNAGIGVKQKQGGLHDGKREKAQGKSDDSYKIGH